MLFPVITGHINRCMNVIVKLSFYERKRVPLWQAYISVCPVLYQ